MVKMEPITPPQPPTKPEFLEYVEEYYSNIIQLFYELADLETDPFLLEWFEWFQSEELRKNIFEEYFNGDWRSGQEVHKVVITQRLYQTSPNSTQE